MNKDRRQRLRKAIDQLETVQTDLDDIKSEEELAYDNLPESIQLSERGDEMQEAIETLDGALDAIQDTISNLDEIAG